MNRQPYSRKPPVDSAAICRRRWPWVVLLCLCTMTTKAADKERTWTVSPMLGLFSPRLSLLNDGEFRSQMPGRGRIILPDSGVNLDFEFIVDNPLPAIRYGSDAGAEIGFRINERHGLFFGMSSWEATSTGVIVTEMPFQGTLSKTLYERSGKISYTQFYLGWRWRFLQRDRFSLHSLLSLHELYDIDYKEDLVFAFLDGPATSFKRLIVTQSQATGVQLIRFGIAAQYRLFERFSLGLDAGYFASYRKFLLGNASLQTDLQDQDNLSFRLPSRQDAAGRLQYLARTTGFTDTQYESLRLDFSGWNLMIKANFHF